MTQEYKTKIIKMIISETDLSLLDLIFRLLYKSRKSAAEAVLADETVLFEDKAA